MSNDKETRITDSGGNQIVVKSTDARLTRSLNIEEFRQAFFLYRNIICEKEPLRRAEFDTYFDFIESLHSQFGGSKFYGYHNAFSKKAAMYHAHYQTIISWANKDADLYLHIFAGERSRACDACKSMLHSTRFCPESLSNPNPSRFNSDAKTKLDRRGRQRVYHQGKETCNNYNTSGCNLDHGNSNIVHNCLQCKADSHSASECPRKALPLSKMGHRVRNDYVLIVMSSFKLILAIRICIWRSIIDSNIKATTNINIDQLELELLHHPNPQYVNHLILGLRNGFDTGIKDLPLTSYECNNLLSAKQNPDKMSELLNSELEKGCLIGPFTQPPFDVYRINPIGLVQGYRLIFEEVQINRGSFCAP